MNTSQEAAQEPAQEPAQHQSRPVSIPHLVFGVIFTGGAAVWAIGQATDADLPRSAIGFPVVLILAGIVGLVVSLVNARQRSTSSIDSAGSPEEPTIVLEYAEISSEPEERR